MNGKVSRRTTSAAIRWQLVLRGSLIAVAVHGGVLAARALGLGGADASGAVGAAAAVLCKGMKC
jgi:hypothetical protein